MEGNNINDNNINDNINDNVIFVHPLLRNLIYELVNYEITTELDNELNNIINNSFTNQKPHDTPCSLDFLNTLEEIEVTEEHVSKELKCAICLDDFKLNEKIIGVPCKPQKHYFHIENENCEGIIPWLKKNNTCPVCRTEFPKIEESDDDDSLPSLVNTDEEDNNEDNEDNNSEENNNEDNNSEENNNEDNNDGEVNNNIPINPLYNNYTNQFNTLLNTIFTANNNIPNDMFRIDIIPNVNIPQGNIPYNNMTNLHNNMQMNNTNIFNIDEEGFSNDEINEAIRLSMENTTNTNVDND